MENLGKITFGLLVVISVVFLNAFIVSYLWGWFIIPIFHVGSITYLQSSGLSLFIGYFTANRENKDSDKVWINFITSILVSLVTFGLAYIIHLLG